MSRSELLERKAMTELSQAEFTRFITALDANSSIPWEQRLEMALRSAKEQH